MHFSVKNRDYDSGIIKKTFIIKYFKVQSNAKKVVQTIKHSYWSVKSRQKQFPVIVFPQNVIV
jgi:hypothetical protein